MEQKIPLFSIVKEIEDESIAGEVIQLSHALGINYAEQFRDFYRDDLLDGGASEQTVQILDKIIASHNISYKPPLREPISILEDKITEPTMLREFRLYSKFAQLSTIEDLAKQNQEQLKNNDVSDQLISMLNTLLKNEYKVSFGFMPEREIRTKNETRRGYEVVDSGNQLVVNSLPITIGSSGGALPKEKVLKIYQMHSNGSEPEDIAKNLDINQLTVRIYLRRAKVILEARSRSITSNTSRHYAASGSPPRSLMEYAPKGFALIGRCLHDCNSD